MPLDLDAPPASLVPLLTERHLGSLTTLRPDGSPHVVAVGWTWEPERHLVRVITRAGSRKVANLRAAAGDPVRSRAVVCSVDGRHWVSLAGPATVVTDPDRVAEAVRRYALRYGEPRASAERVALEISVDLGLGSGWG